MHGLFFHALRVNYLIIKQFCKTLGKVGDGVELLKKKCQVDEVVDAEAFGTEVEDRGDCKLRSLSAVLSLSKGLSKG